VIRLNKVFNLIQQGRILHLSSESRVRSLLSFRKSLSHGSKLRLNILSGLGLSLLLITLSKISYNLAAIKNLIIQGDFNSKCISIRLIIWRTIVGRNRLTLVLTLKSLRQVLISDEVWAASITELRWNQTFRKFLQFSFIGIFNKSRAYIFHVIFSISLRQLGAITNTCISILLKVNCLLYHQLFNLVL